MNPILARLRTLLTFIIGHSISIDLRPQTETVQMMIQAYYRGVEHLHRALDEFLIAKELWDKLHKV